MIQESLFGEPKIEIQTEGIKYAGSKLKLLPDILGIISSLPAQTVWDPFSGTTRVSQALSKSGYSVVSSDRAEWSKVFATCYLMNEKEPTYYQELIDHLNNLTPISGWFTENYGSDKPFSECGIKRPWQSKNTRKLDVIREEIDKLNLNEVDKSVALTSLILALDKVDSTLGHFVSYLKDWSPRSYNDLFLTVPRIWQNTASRNKVICGDVFDLTKSVTADVTYLDPPYGSNNEKMPPSRVRYASYYHVWTTICLNDQPDLFGKANRRKDTSDVVAGSVFEEFRKDSDGNFIAVKAIERLIKEVNSRWIVLSYSSGGRATAQELVKALSDNGDIKLVKEIDYKKNVMAEMKWTNEWLRKIEEPHKEFLFLLDKGEIPRQRKVVSTEMEYLETTKQKAAVVC